MSKLVRFFAIATLIAGALAMTPGPAAAQRHGHGGHGGHSGGSWHGGGGWRGGGGHWRGGGWGGGWGWGPGVIWGLGYPYYGGYYYDEPNCGWVRVRVLRHRHWVLRRAWRCW